MYQLHGVEQAFQISFRVRANRSDTRIEDQVIVGNPRAALARRPQEVAGRFIGFFRGSAGLRDAILLALGYQKNRFESLD